MERGSEALSRLDVLVGEWALEGTNPLPGGEPVRGRAAFEWLPGGGFLVQRWSIEPPEFPSGVAVIGVDPTGGGLLQHYFDSRGVARVYGMTLEDGVWRLWREGEPFDQRFIGELTEDGDAFAGRWERSEAGRWVHDFALTFRRVPGAR